MGRKESNQTNKTNPLPANDGISLWNFKTHRIQCMLYFSITEDRNMYIHYYQLKTFRMSSNSYVVLT